MDIVSDSVVEPNEALCLKLSNPVNACLGTITTATLTILDDDAPPVTVQFQSASYTISESGVKAAIAVTLSAASLNEVTVYYSTEDGTAVGVDDYTPIAGNAHILPWSAEQDLRCLYYERHEL